MVYLLNVFCTITRQKKVICLSRGWYDDEVYGYPVVKYPKPNVPFEGLRRQCQ